jgi:hypothetical protein
MTTGSRIVRASQRTSSTVPYAASTATIGKIGISQRPKNRC